VVTRDADVIAIGRAFGVTIVSEDANRGHTAAVAHAQREAVTVRAGVFLTIPGDVPCVRPEEIDALTRAASESGVAFTPSRSGLGTNGAALAPPQAMALTFGEPSFDNHLAAARRGGFSPRVLAQAGLGLDIDDPGDLRALLTEGSHTESGRLVGGWTVAERLSPPVGARDSR
jgi:2-phospho-L-lactate guanylyltransferase